jgi:radical SAM family uncharacterized protein/radical SAM-linked protein
MKNKKIEAVLEDKILPFVSKPGRYIGNEYNIIMKDAAKVSVRVALAFPEVYEIAMSYIGFDILYHILNKHKHIWAERVYAPWPDMEKKMRGEEVALYSLESFTPLQEFDIIGFTLQYELTYTNILNMLDLSGIPVWAKDRNDDHPIILAGGPCSCNPEPMAAFIDAFLIGDGEESFVEICNTVVAAKKTGKSRQKILTELSKIRGVYIPSFYDVQFDNDGMFTKIQPNTKQAPERILTCILPQLKAEHYPEKPVVPIINVTHDRLAVEVMRGCTNGCRFCNAGMIYRPVRERNQDEIIDQIIAVIDNTGYEEVSLLSLSISDYSGLNGLIAKGREALDGMNVNVSFPSIRADSFTKEIAEFAASIRKSGFTFAPEAGSERLRSVINKNISDQNLYESIHIALSNGWKLLKFYFMIGLPTETMEDIESIADLIENIVRISRQYGGVRFNVSVSPFSPKTHTPFQWERQDNKEEFLEKINILRRRFARIKQVKFSWRDPDVSLVECVLGRADRRMAQAIYLVWKNGAIFEGWSENFKIELWEQAVKQAGLSIERFAGEFPEDNPLPWDHIDKGVVKKFLLRERHNAFQEKTIIDCKKEGCFNCGIQRKGEFSDFTECYTKAGSIKNDQPINQKQYFAVKSEEKSIKHVLRKTDFAPENTISLRLQYKKAGYARYLSHLNLIRVFDRACRRARIPLVYSHGFNPHPKISFGPSLSLGFTSDAEYLDLEIDGSFRGGLADLLNCCLPPGLQITTVKPIKQKVVSLTAAINLAEYEVNLKESNIDEMDFKRSLEKLLAAENIEVERRVKGKYKTINIRPYIVSVAHSDCCLRIKTKAIDNRTVRIGEILQKLFENNSFDVRRAQVHRKMQLIRRGEDEKTPLEILP